MILETKRLLLRALTPDDWADLADILQDPVAMTAYEGPFSDAEVTQWLERQLARYAQDGIGLWAVLLRETGAFVGQCGLTWQEAGGERLLEVGYLFKRRHWHHGYATEAAAGCMRYAFETLRAPRVHSIIRDTNAASIRVAQRNGMRPAGRLCKQYRGVDMPHTIYRADGPGRREAP